MEKDLHIKEGELSAYTIHTLIPYKEHLHIKEITRINAVRKNETFGDIVWTAVFQV